MSALTHPVAEAPPRLGRLPFYYGWVNVVLAALAMTATMPGRTHGLGLITKPLLLDLDISERLYGELNFWSILLGAAFCLPGGRILDRWGSRVVLTVVSLALGAAVLVMAAVTDWVALFLILVLVRGLGQGTLSVASMALVGKWFTRRLGVAMGVFSVLLAIGFIAATLGVGDLVIRFGWRTAWSALGWMLLLGLAPLSWLLVRSSPEACGLTPESGAPEDSSEPSGAGDVPLSAALRTPAFWVFGLATSLFGLVWSAITLFNEAILDERGFNTRTFYLVMALLTAGGLVSNLIGGWLAQRGSMGRLLAVAMLLLAAALAIFPSVRTTGQVVGYALLLGVAGGLLTVIFFAFYGHAFGRTHLGKIQGAAQVLSIVASALGPLVLALCKEGTGSYSGLFYGAAPVAALLGVCAWVVSVPRAGRA